MSELTNIRQTLARLEREHFRELCDLRERVAKLERSNVALRRRLEEEREEREAAEVAALAAETRTREVARAT